MNSPIDENIGKLQNYFSAKLSKPHFDKLSRFITSEFGIKMPEAKKIMLQSRLQKRLRALKIPSFERYMDYVFGEKGNRDEIINLIDVVSTNKTDFFREPAHFEFLKDEILAKFGSQTSIHRTLKVWSAGCSSGEEPYTIAMVISEMAEKIRGLDYSILGTDISKDILLKAANAVYREGVVENIPMSLKKKYFLKSKDRVNPTVRISPGIRNRVNFMRLNFMDGTYLINEIFDIIFCRNVLIYFERATQEKVINKLCMKLKSGGYFFLGHSESIMNMNVPLKQIKPTIFQRI